MSKDNSKKNYLNRPIKKKGMKETLLYGNGSTLAEKEKLDKKYKKKKLNE